SMLKKIATQARLAIEEMTGEAVNLKVFVKVRKDWRDNAGILRSLGYDTNRKN
ncbi:MAG: KH domain-containing protein, partial [Lachnospiraceae bacterium]|nr:KH domain-containing protein [Lachnospiraceae bacterium]